MPANFYEVLDIGRNATPEEIRRAYRRKALETHPDRLPQGASAAEKSVSEELFRKVNNAYEVLCDPQSRAEYDRLGVWPPPAPAPQGPFANGPHDPFSNPFFRGPFSDPPFRDSFSRDPFSRGPRTDPFGGFGFGSPFGASGFTDPFVLFNSIFGDLHRAFEADSSFDGPFGRRGFASDHFGGGFLNSTGGFPPMMLPPFGVGGGAMRNGMMRSLSDGEGGARWVSESWSSSSVNGATHTKCVRKDSEGNEHIIYRFPDGTERRTINGIEQSASQPPRALLQSAPPVPSAPYSTQAVAIPPPPPPYSEAVAQPPHHSRSTRHHGHHNDYSGDRREHRDRHRHAHSQDKERDRAREYENGYDYRGDGRGQDPQNDSSWKFWRS